MPEGRPIPVDQPRRDQEGWRGAGEGDAGGAGLEGGQIRPRVAHAFREQGHGAAPGQDLVDLPEALLDGFRRGVAIPGSGHGDGPERGQEGPQGRQLPEGGLGQPPRPAVQRGRGCQGVQQAVRVVEQDQAGPRRQRRAFAAERAEPDPRQEPRRAAGAHLRPARAGAAPIPGPGR